MFRAEEQNALGPLSHLGRHRVGAESARLVYVTGRGVVLFASLALAWGIPYLLIKVAVEELDPAMVVFGRSALGALALLPLAVYRKQVLMVLRRWRPLIAYTVVEIVIPWYFLSTAETRLPSSTAGLLIAAVPLVGVAVALAFGRPVEFFQRRRLRRWRAIRRPRGGQPMAEVPVRVDGVPGAPTDARSLHVTGGFNGMLARDRPEGGRTSSCRSTSFKASPAG